MGSWSFAPKFTRLTFSTSGSGGAKQVESGESVRVWGYAVTKGGSGNATLNIESADGTVTYDDILISASTTNIFDIPWIADKGIRCYATDGTGNATDVSITFWHSHPGS